MANERAFWKWFVNRENDLMHFENDREATFDALAARLQRVHPDLTFEFGPEENGTREFIISAGGIKKAFPAVESLVAAAPELSRWKITAFIPRRPIGNIIEFGDHRIDPKDVQYSLLRGKNDLGLYLFIPGYLEDDHEMGQVGYLFLDEALGEYDVEMKVGLIKMFPPEAETSGPRYPLEELPTHFDQAYAKLQRTD
jgi:hypothetical protein